MLVSYWFSEHKYAKQISFDFWLKAIDSQKMFLHFEKGQMTSCSDGKYLVLSYIRKENSIYDHFPDVMK